MGILIKLADQFRGASGEICLVDVPEKLIALFTLLGLHVVIKIAKSEEDAVKILQQSNKSGTPAKNLPAPTSTPAKSQPASTPAKSQPASTPAKSQPASTPAKSQPVLASAKSQPVLASAKSQPAPASTPAKSQPAPASAPAKSQPAPAHPAGAKTLIVKCQKCHSNISLGVQLRQGTYRCPRCMVTFKVLDTGKIKFLIS